MIEIIGQPKLAPSSEIKQAAKDCINKLEIDKNKIVEILFVDSARMRELNKEHRKIDKATDVLSFPQHEQKTGQKQIFGSIVICEEIADQMAEEDVALVKHGFLHLAGYDHETDSKGWNDAVDKLNLLHKS